MSTGILSLKKVSKSWANRCVLNKINFTGNTGELSVITGPSGSGKSTLCALAGLIEPADSGEITFNGENVNHLNEKQRAQKRARHIGFVFQRHFLLNTLTPRRNIELGARYSGENPKTDWMEDLTKRLGVYSLLDQKVNTLSGGEAQRIAIARALIIKPALLIADEPTGNLDNENSQTIMRELKKIADDGVCVVVVSHDHAWLNVADRHYRCESQNLVPQR